MMGFFVSSKDLEDILQRRNAAKAEFERLDAQAANMSLRRRLTRLVRKTGGPLLVLAFFVVAVLLSR